jgi:hypothetical protein
MSASLAPRGQCTACAHCAAWVVMSWSAAHGAIVPRHVRCTSAFLPSPLTTPQTPSSPQEACECCQHPYISHQAPAVDPIDRNYPRRRGGCIASHCGGFTSVRSTFLWCVFVWVNSFRRLRALGRSQPSVFAAGPWECTVYLKSKIRSSPFTIRPLVDTYTFPALLCNLSLCLRCSHLCCALPPTDPWWAPWMASVGCLHRFLVWPVRGGRPAQHAHSLVDLLRQRMQITVDHGTDFPTPQRRQAPTSALCVSSSGPWL